MPQVHLVQKVVGEKIQLCWLMKKVAEKPSIQCDIFTHSLSLTHTHTEKKLMAQWISPAAMKSIL
jgi:hypothetical protein